MSKRKSEKVIRYITDYLEISSDDSNREQIKFKYPSRSFLTMVCKTVILQKVFVKIFLHFSVLVLCLNHRPCLKISVKLQVFRLAKGYGNTSI